MNLERIYRWMPIPVQNAACCAAGMRIRLTRYGREFHKLLRQAEARTFWSCCQIKALREERLRRFVYHAATTVPFYREQFADHGIDPNSIRSLDDLSQLPVLDKATVQARCVDLLSESVLPRNRRLAHTSGTTGGGLRFYVTTGSIQQQWATWWRYRRWHQLDLDVWCGYFGGRSVVPLAQQRPPYWRYNIPGRQILFSGYHMSPGTMGYYVDEIRRAKPAWLHGYPSLLALLAGYLLDRGERLGFALRWITVAAENLLPQQAGLIEEALGVAPIQHYGMAEGVANISQCPHNKLHVDDDFSAVEFLENNGGGYRVVGTNFSNPAFPLLRYDVGDLVHLDSQPCPCGRPGRVVSSVDGRQEDYIELKNGARLGRMDHIFKDLINIREAQIFQDVPGMVVVRVVRGDGYEAQDERRLLQEFRQRVGDQAEIRVDYVDRLPRSKTGKLRFVVSQAAKGRFTREPV